MKSELRRDRVLDEEVHRYELDSGLPVLVHRKRGFQKKFAVLGADFGSVDRCFVDRASGRRVELPDGVAHFLEHKLFELEDGDAFEIFSRQGASANAATSFRNTSYFMSCSSRFPENLRTLLQVLRTPHMTQPSVEKEQGIIAQEIRMYEDSADWRCFMNLVEGLYVRHPIRIDITGSVESIRRIDLDLLNLCYDNFYDPANLCLVVSGDVDPDEVAAMADRVMGHGPANAKVVREPVREPRRVARRMIDVELPVVRGKLLLGFKDRAVPREGEAMRRRDMLTAVLLALMIGASSDRYRRLYESGTIDDSFYTSYAGEENFGYLTLGCETDEPEKTRAALLREVRRFGREGFRTEDFGRIIHQLTGRFVRSLDSMEAASFALMTSEFRGLDPFHTPALLRRITLDDVMERHAELFGERNHSTSICRPPR